MSDTQLENKKLITGNGIESLQQRGIDYLYDLELQQNNLFYVACFQDYKSNNDSDDGINLLSPYFRINSISFGSPKLTFQWNETMRINTLDKVDLSDVSKITVTWYDDVYKSVYLYHLKWLQKWYNTQGDYLPVGIEGKFKKLIMYTYHYADNSEYDLDLLSKKVPTTEWIFRITCSGIVPETFGETSLKFDMKQSNATTGVTATYKINGLKLEVNPKLDPFFPIDEYASQEEKDNTDKVITEKNSFNLI